MNQGAIRAAFAGLGCLVACASTRVPANGGSATNAGGDASAPSAALAGSASSGAADAGPGTADVPEAAVASTARDASVADDEDRDAAATLVFDLGAARSGESKLAVLVNVEAFRASTAGRQLGPVVAALTHKQDFDHIDDLGVAWVLFTGPSMERSAHGTLLMFCTASDAKIDHWLDARRSDPHGGSVDAGPPGVHAVVGRADGAARVFMRPQSHVVAMVPPELATEAARVLQSARIPAHADPGEAFRFRARHPQHTMSELPASITEVRFWIAPRKDQGADFFLEGDTPGATMVAQQLQDFLDKEVDVSVRNATLGVFDHPEITATGDVAKMHIRATEAQLWAIMQPILAELTR